MKTRLHRWLGAAALGGGLFFLWTGTAGAEPDVNISGATIGVDDVGGPPEPTIDATPPVGAEAVLGTNHVVVGDPDAPVAAEVASSDLPDPAIITPGATTDVAAGDATASAVAPVATADPDVVVCGNAAGALGDAGAGCDPAADDGTTGTTAEPGSLAVAVGDTTLDGALPEVVADPDVLVCGNAVGIVGDATAGCGAGGEPAPVADAGSLDLVLGGDTPVSGTTLDSALPGVLADPDAVACGNGIGVRGDAGGTCTPAADTAPAAEAGSLDLALGGTTPLSGTTLTGDVPGVATSPEAMACGNGAGIAGDGSGGCAPAAADEPLAPVETAGVRLAVGGTTPVEGSSATVGLSSTTIDPGATACGNGAGVLGDGSGTCGGPGSPVPAVAVAPSGTAAVVVDLGALSPLPGSPPTGDGGIDVGPVRVGGLGRSTTPVEPAPSSGPAPSRPGLAVDGSLVPIAGGGITGAGSFAPLGATGAGGADLTATGAAGGLLAGRAAAGLALTGFGIRAALSFASVLLALGALLLAGRRRVELLCIVS